MRTQRDEPSDGSQVPLAPPISIGAEGLEGRLRLVARWLRFGVQSIRSRDWDFVGNAGRALAVLTAMSILDAVHRSHAVECNICGWTGRRFYPNTGPGYDDYKTTCPGCRGIDRHRSLLALLVARTEFFTPGTRIVEVAPMRGFEQLCLAQGDLDYTSFDLQRHAMVRGDITAMDFESESVDFFVCFHVLEHIPDADRALSEIHRVLRRGGTAVLQVPIDANAEETVEYGAPDPRDVGHVRRYGRDFPELVAAAGFGIDSVAVGDVFDGATIAHFGLSAEPIYLARRD